MLRWFLPFIVIISVVKFVHSSNHLKCGKNEILTSCENRVCEYRTCSDVGQPIECEKVDHKNCIKGCICKKNYLRASNGMCIPADQCPPSCGENEIPTSCIENIDERRNCSDLLESVACVQVDPQYCTDGCICKDGYLKDCNNICIPYYQCPEAQCGKNEEFDLCPPMCPGEECGADTNSSCAPNPKPGSPSCQPSCRCCNGYRRNKYGNCIPEENCPSCGENEIPTSCIENIDERRNCSDLLESVACVQVDPQYCTDGCLCKDGYLRNSTGTCIPYGQCPEAQCGENEEFDLCPQTCPSEECGADTSNSSCAPNPEPGSPSCQPSCRCCNGYRRSVIDGCCIPEDDCPTVCGENEIPTTCIESQCGRRECSDIPEPVACVRVNTQFCTDGCICVDGYLRDMYNTCIPMDQCPEAQCDDNEYFDPCPTPCSEDCGVDLSLVLCLSPEPGSPSCQPSCRCCDGYRRNKYGNCIPEEKCPTVCGENEIPTTCIESQCGRRECSDIPEPVDCLGTYTVFCTEGCLCVDGYLKAENNTCIPMDQCPEAQCDDNEYFDPCPTPCSEDCGVDLSLVLCLSPEPGSPSCQPSCRCCDGYRRNKYGNCIPEEKCPPPIICGPNEEYNSCVNGGCARRNCSQPGVICINLIEGACIEGCQCKDKFLRADNGTCIPEDQCPPNCSGENEVVGCQRTCPPQTCESIGRKYKCPKQTGECIQECRCKQGYYRNAIGECISRAQCLNCTGPNEYFSCGGACDNVCATLAEQNQTSCPIENDDCNPMCYCLEGYARDCNGTCIPISNCPPPPLNCSGENEVVGCQRTCPPQTCESIGRRYNCPKQTGECIQECRCKQGYYRNAIGECISRAQCLNCTGPNEYFSCGGACDNVCDTLAEQNQTSCPIENDDCNPMCYCLEGYARDCNDTCIPISQCPPPPQVECGPNAVYNSSCSESCDECPPQDCDICLTVPCEPIQDPPGCRCIDDYLRNKEGSCVPSDQCEVECGPNAVYNSSCSESCDECPPQDCDICLTVPCEPIQDPPGCRCIDNYQRNKEGSCVPSDQCETIPKKRSKQPSKTRN